LFATLDDKKLKLDFSPVQYILSGIFYLEQIILINLVCMPNKQRPHKVFWKYHLTGWVVYTVFVLIINITHRFPLSLILIETLFFFVFATGFYFLIHFFEQKKWIQIKPTERLDCMLIICSFVGVVVGLLWAHLMLNHLFEIFITADHQLPKVPKDLLFVRYYWGRMNDAIFLFSIWGFFWFSFNYFENHKNKIIPNSVFVRCLYFSLLLIVINIVGGLIVFAAEKRWQALLVELGCQLILVSLSIYVLYSILFSRKEKQPPANILNSYVLIFILLLPLAMLNSIVMNYMTYYILDYVNPDIQTVLRYSLSGVSLVDLIRRISGVGRQFFHGAFLLSLLWIFYEYQKNYKVNDKSIRVFPTDKHFWFNNIISWLILGIVLILLNNWKYSDVSLFAFVYSLLKVVMLGSILSLVIRFLILRYEWNLLSLYQLIPRLTLIAIIMGLMLIFLDFYTEAVLQALYFGHAKYDAIYTRIDSDLVAQSLYTKSVLFVLWLFIWSFVYSFFVSEKKKMELALSSLRLQKENQESQLSLLHNQLDPHFIFNTLTGIRYLILQNPTLARDSLVKLSELLRKNLGKHQFNKIMIKEEMVLVKDYLDLYRIQLEDKLTWREDIQEEAWECLIPPMIIQMLVENALKHGLSLAMNSGYIHLIIKVKDNKLVLLLENSVDQQTDKKPSSNGVGIDNIRKRLRLIYGEFATFEILIMQDKAQVSLIIPKEISNESIGN
jgi:two-component system, LytTR family, sensor kinase